MASSRKFGGAKSAPAQAVPAPVVSAPVVSMTAAADAPVFDEPAVSETAVTADEPMAEVEAVAAESHAAPEPVAEIVEPVEEIVEPAAPAVSEEPAPVEATVSETETLLVASVPSVTNMPEMNKFFEAPMASLSEAQTKARSIAEAGLSETRAKLSQYKSAADEAASAIETSYATVKNGAVEFNTKAIEAFKATAYANFDFVKSVMGVKSPSEYVTLHSEFARKQIETMQSHAKAFGELAQKIATDSVEPIKTQVAKTFNLPL
jgi:phasin